MANSRSNIYPVQLQGAELNLNKLDAEIKQYSGFNKNNSPFVGGCLSNIFVRTQNVEGATDDNTIIDEEGNIYTVDTEGFYKNGEKVIAYEDAPFIECEKFSVTPDVVKAFSDDLFLREVNNYYYLNDIELGYFTNGDRDTFVNIVSVGVWYEGKFIFVCTVKPTLTSGNQLRILCLEKNESGEYVIGDLNYTLTGSGTNYEKTSPRAILISNDVFCIPAIYKSDFSQIKNAFTCFVGNIHSSEVTKYFCFVDVWPSWGRFAEGWSNSYSNRGGLIDLNHTHNEIDFYSYPRNLIVYKKISDDIFVANDKPVAFAIKVNPDTDLEVYPNPSTLQETENAIRFILRPENVEVKTPSTNYFPTPENTATAGYMECGELNNSLVKNTTGFIKYENQTVFFNPLSGVLVSLDEDNNFQNAGGATLKMKNCLFSVLFNNNFISGIAAYNDHNKILVSEWNGVKAGTISYFEESAGGDISLVYGDYNNNYYILRKTNKPQIKRIYNQIVSNVLLNQNSFDIKRDKTLYFAPGLNCSSSHTANADHFRKMNTSAGVRYCASAINEYSQEDNSSIILNPVLAFITLSSGYTANFAEQVRYFYTNIYKGEVEVKYSSSSIWLGDAAFNTTINNLKGLPFPSDTNGNVEYSPNLFSEMTQYGTDVFIKSGNTAYPLVIGNNNEPIMSFYMASGVENLNAVFIIQGQYYGTIGNQLFSMQFSGGVIQNVSFIVDITGLQFVGNTPYEALFFSKTNRCLFSFTGANVLTQKQFIDKISEVKDYLYNPATQTVFLITDIGVLFYGLFGQFLLEYPDISKIFLLQNGIVMSDNAGNYRYIKYYLDESDTDFVKENIRLETCFYGMNNQTVTINDCLYMRIFSEEHEEGDLEVSATTLSLEGRMTEKTTFRIKERDWDKLTHTIYLRYQPKEQRGLGISFSINSPFKIASLSIGSQADAILVDKVSKGAINAPQRTSNNVEW